MDSDWTRQENMVRLNILALMKMTYLFGNDMKTRGSGSILNLSSVGIGFIAHGIADFYILHEMNRVGKKLKTIVSAMEGRLN